MTELSMGLAASLAAVRRDQGVGDGAAVQLPAGDRPGRRGRVELPGRGARRSTATPSTASCGRRSAADGCRARLPGLEGGAEEVAEVLEAGLEQRSVSGSRPSRPSMKGTSLK
jgi:hypothetical protein